ncbi:MAG: M23 family metallopeptidase [Desulfarculaceae bacterium]|jgi:murein DD-endopeptidase MepM/ murein hydrolase activator NlpD
MAAKRRTSLYVILALVLLLGAVIIFFWPHFMGPPPRIALKKTPTHLGMETTVSFQVMDMGMGLAHVSAVLKQGQKQTTLMDETVTEKLQPGQEKKVDLKVEPKKLGLSQGPASLFITARDRSLGNWFRGKLAQLELKLVVDTIPPRLTPLSRTIHLGRGGSGLALYRISKDAVAHGVQVGSRNFRGVNPWSDNPQVGLCYFAFNQDEEKTVSIQAWVEDAAGNRSQSNLNIRLRWTKFRKDDITLSDKTLLALAQRFSERAPKDRSEPLQVFLWENEDLRKENHTKIKDIVNHSTPQQLWQGVFSRPRGKPMAGFGDRRTYFYQGKEVSRAVHLGVDLADVAHSPIRAVARGKVLWAGALGIYGNCVILDHGQGVASLYGHLSRMDVQKGQEVKQEQQLGLSGATGLALGDHLHFSVLVGGVFVKPTEWWDPHWIQDNIELRFQEAEMKAPRQP